MLDRKAWGAVVLAGGGSTRMGRPKAWLEIGGQPLLRRIVDTIGTVCGCVVVVGSPGQTLPALPADALRIDDPAERAHRGPLIGITTGLAELDERGSDLAYLGSCDAVFTSEAHVRFMLSRLARERVEAVVAFDRDGDGKFVHPLASAVRVAAARRAAEALVVTGERSATKLFDRVDSVRLPAEELPDPRVLRTCNTPREWENAVREASGG